MNLLTDEQVKSIAEIVKKDCDETEINYDVVTETCLNIFEKISGLECLSEQEQLMLVNNVWDVLNPK